jgi:protein phosphatase
MGTTLTLGYILWPRLYLVHVGNTRAYLYRDGELEQLTVDQTLQQELGGRPRWSEVLCSMVGGDAKLKTEAYKATLQFGDTLLLCTDGLTHQVTDEEIATRLSAASSAEGACTSILEDALKEAPTEDSTVIVARFADTIGAPVPQLSEEALSDHARARQRVETQQLPEALESAGP